MTFPESDFQIKLRQAFEHTNYKLPSPKQLQDLEEEMEEESKDPGFSPRELAIHISRKNKHLITNDSYDKTKGFLTFLKENYTMFLSSKSGMNKYMSENRVDPHLRSCLIKLNHLEYKGEKANRIYKWGGKLITKDLVYDVCYYYKTHVKKKPQVQYTRTQVDFMLGYIRSHKPWEVFEKNIGDRFPNHSTEAVKKKYNRTYNKENYGKTNNIMIVDQNKGNIPSDKAIINEDYMERKKEQERWSISENLLFYFCKYHGLSFKKMSELLNKPERTLYQKGANLKNKGLMTVEATHRYLMEHNPLLNKLLVEPSEAVIPEVTDVQLELVTKETIEKPIAKPACELSDKPVEFLIQEIKKNRKTMRKNKKQLKRLEDDVKMLKKIILND